MQDEVARLERLGAAMMRRILMWMPASAT